MDQMTDKLYLSEVFKIVEGAARLDNVKVRNYAGLLADKLEADGEETSARRLRKLLSAPASEMRPAFVGAQAAVPVDSESRFPLLEQCEVSGATERFIGAGSEDQVIEEFVAAAEHREQLLNHGLGAASALLLHGPPGCGKTLLAEVISERLALPLYVARLDGVISSYLGSTAKNLRAIFEFAARTPCVLFLDEFDALAKLRDDSQEVGELKRVVNTFIQTLDRYRNDLVLVAATNHEQLLDSAIWRRFSFILRLDYPSLKQRRALWRAFLGGNNWSEQELEVLADLSEGFSCSAIKETSERLMQRWITKGERQTLREAVETLFGKVPYQSRTEPILSVKELADPQALYTALRGHNQRLYTQEVVSEIAGISRATMARKLRAKTPPPAREKPRSSLKKRRKSNA